MPDTEPDGSRSLLLTILLPCLNEAETVGGCIENARSGLRAAGIAAEQSEIIVADNGSTDRSAAIARDHGARVIAAQPVGYGAALQAGISAARSQYVIMADADGSYDLTALSPFVERLGTGCTLVIGTRLCGEIRAGAMPFLSRYVGNPALTAIGNRLFGTQISDYHCGLRGFDRAALLALNLRAPGMEFATEMIVRAASAHLSIAEVPIVYNIAGRSRPSHLRPWRDGWRHLQLMLRLWTIQRGL